MGVILGRGRTYQGVTNPPDRSERASELFRAHSARVYSYARRHVDESACDDVVSETFVVACRRLDAIPDEPLPWLLVVARNVISNQRRTAARADQVWFAAVRSFWHAPLPVSPDVAVTERDHLLGALEQCTRVEREALLLVAWDGLTPTQAADVAGCSTRAFTVRLHRARQRLSAAMESVAEAIDPPRQAPTHLAPISFAVQEPS